MTKAPATPQYQHDCSTCHFLGRLGTMDMYWHDQPSGIMPDYILRYSSDGPDYSSNCDFENRIYQECDRQYTTPGHWSRDERDKFLRRMTCVRLLASSIVGNMEYGQ